MNAAHFHLLVNHFPIILPIVGLLVLIAGLLMRAAVIQRTALAILIAGALFTVPAFVSGEGAEEIVEHLPEVGHDIIHEHEEIAETFALLSYALGILAMVALWANYTQKEWAKWTHYGILLVGLFVLYFAQKTGTSGGEIRHTEIRKQNKEAQKDGQKKTEKAEEQHDDD